MCVTSLIILYMSWAIPKKTPMVQSQTSLLLEDQHLVHFGQNTDNSPFQEMTCSQTVKNRRGSNVMKKISTKHSIFLTLSEIALIPYGLCYKFSLGMV